MPRRIIFQKYYGVHKNKKYTLFDKVTRTIFTIVLKYIRKMVYCIYTNMAGKTNSSTVNMPVKRFTIFISKSS